MNTKYFTLAYFLLISGFCSAQNQIIKGRIIDKNTLLPIENAHITLPGNIYGAKSNNSGQFVFKTKNKTDQIEVTHVSYEKQNIDIHLDNKEILIVLNPRSIELATFEASDRALCLIKDKPLWVWDYTFYKNNILLLAFKENSFLHPSLIIINEYGDTLYSCNLKKINHFYSDFKQNRYLMSNQTTWQISSSDSNLLQFINPFDTDSLMKLFEPFVAENNNTFFLKKQYYNDQNIKYYYIKANNRKLNEFASIADESLINMIENENRRQSILKLDEFDLRFEKEFMQKPIFAPLLIFDDTTYILNFVDDQIEKYDINQVPISSLPISFHHQKSWKPQIIIDQKKQDVYAIYRKDGLTSIGRINLQNGNIENMTEISHFEYIENIQINNGILYFLYKEKTNYEYKKIYKQKI